MANLPLLKLRKVHHYGKRLRKQKAGSQDKNGAGQARQQYNKKADAFCQRICKQVTLSAAFTEQPCAMVLGNQDGACARFFIQGTGQQKVTGCINFELGCCCGLD